MKQPFETGAQRYQPDKEHTFNENPNYVLNQRRLASFVGLAAIGLPVVLLTATLFGTCFYYSLSHFYYAQFQGGIFIGVLVFIATFLFAYRGANESENALATWAGLCALGVALFPTEGRGCDLESYSGRAFSEFQVVDGEEFITILKATPENPYFELFPSAGALHFASAAVLFAFLAWYTLRVFTRVVAADHRKGGAGDAELTDAKKWRNRFYRAAGWSIIACMIVMALNFVYWLATGKEFGWWNANRVTFWLESLCLWAFGWSWIIKGRLFGNLLLDERDQDILNHAIAGK